MVQPQLVAFSAREPWWPPCPEATDPPLTQGFRSMASVCDICGKKPQFGMRLSHSHRRTKRRWNPNVQRVRAIVNGSPKRVHVCTSCLKAGKVQKP
jgi:large subunit ribosomal protein L28